MNLRNLYASARGISDASNGLITEERTRHYLRETRSTPRPPKAGERGSRIRLFSLVDVLPILTLLGPKGMWSDAATTALIRSSLTIEEHKNEANIKEQV